MIRFYCYSRTYSLKTIIDSMTRVHKTLCFLQVIVSYSTFYLSILGCIVFLLCASRQVEAAEQESVQTSSAPAQSANEAERLSRVWDLRTRADFHRRPNNHCAIDK